jgi:kynurenine formamidase
VPSLTGRVVDLTQPLGPETLLWPDSRPFEAEVVAALTADGNFARAIALPEHAGTHLDAPSHFVANGTTAAEIPAERLVVPAAVIDVRDACAEDPGYTLERLAIDDAERREGPLEPGSGVLLRTGWDERLGDSLRYYGGPTPEEHRFPGFGRAAAELLLERGVVGLGTDAASIDAGGSEGFPTHNLTMAAGLWHLEGLVNLGALPARGALLFVGALKLVDGSGAPARALALLPEG